MYKTSAFSPNRKLLGYFLLLTLTLNAASGIAQQQESTSPAGKPEATPSVMPKDAVAPMNEHDRLDLIEYRLAEKVESRVIKNVGLYGAIFAIAFAIVGFIGFASIRDAIARGVEKDVKHSIEKDVEAYRSKVQATLIDLQVSVAESKRMGEQAQKQFQALQERHTELEELSRRFEHLHNNVLAMSVKVESALARAEESVQKTDDLRQVVANSFAGNPTIVGGGWGWSVNLPATIDGQNFGDVPGKLQMLIYAHLDTDKVGPGISVARWRMDRVEIPPDWIDRWSNNEIRFYLSKDFYNQVREFQKRVNADKEARGLRSVAFSYEFKVERTDGQTAGYDPPFQPLSPLTETK